MKTLALATMALFAAPVLAQSAPPAPPASPQAAAERAKPRMPRMAHPGPNFSNISPEGRAILRETMKADAADRAALKTARDRINALLAADRLDTAALKRAMDEERRLVDVQHGKRQTAMLAAFQKMSAADRKAFAQDAARSRSEVEARVKRWRDGAARQAPAQPPVSQ